MVKAGLIAFTSIIARWHRPPAAPEGLVASEQTLGDAASLSPEEVLQRLQSSVDGLAPAEAEERLRTVGPNQVARQARHTIAGEILGRSINPLNLLLLTLATASWFLGDQRAAVVIAVMVVLSVSLGFLQEHRSNKAADQLRRMVLTTATVHRRGDGKASEPTCAGSRLSAGRLALIARFRLTLDETIRAGRLRLGDPWLTIPETDLRSSAPAHVR